MALENPISFIDSVERESMCDERRRVDFPLLDQSKNFCAFASVEDFDVIITDDGIKKEDKEELESLGILVIVV